MKTTRLTVTVLVFLLALLSGAALAAQHAPHGGGLAHPEGGAVHGVHHGFGPRECHEMHSLQTSGFSSLMGFVHSLGMVVHHLDLSEEQEARLAALHEELMPQMHALGDPAVAAQKAMATAFLPTGLDEGALRKSLGDLARAQEDFILTLARTLEELDDILSSDQLRQLHDRLAAHFHLVKSE